MKSRASRTAIGSVIAALILVGLVIAYLTTGYLTLDEASRRVPLLAGFVTLGLLVFDLARELRKLAVPARPGGIPTHSEPPSAGASLEWRVLASVALGVAGIYAVGFLIAIPAYLVAAITLIGGRPLRVAAITALVTTATIYIAFELLLSYRLYPGLLFS